MYDPNTFWKEVRDFHGSADAFHSMLQERVNKKEISASFADSVYRMMLYAAEPYPQDSIQKTK